jgi:glycosyltransferase involved in cell wall biosynthesis
MKIWLITIGEPLPSDPGHPRLLRAGLLAESLADRGHEVLWWTSAFDHVRKAQRAPADRRIASRTGLELVLLHGPGYRRNISLARIRNHRALARRFAELAPREARPEVILASFPSIELCLAAACYGRARGVPVALDVRDLWPDIFLDHAPAPLRPLARLALAPLFAQTREAFRLASAVTGITTPFVEWGLRLAGRPPGHLDRAFPMGYPSREVDPGLLVEARAWWKATHGLDGHAGFTAVFTGSFGHQVDLDTVIAAAHRLRGTGIRFVLCGSGENLEHSRRRAAGLDNVILPGWVDAPRIQALMELADVGLAPYFSRMDFLNSSPNQVLEYLAGGLPVLSAIEGLVGELLRENECGEVYGPDDSLTRLSARLLSLRDAPERLRAMSLRARALFEARFDADKVYGEMAAYLQAVARLQPSHQGMA